MMYRMAYTPMTLSELEGHFCTYDWQNASRGPSASAGLLVHNSYLWALACRCTCASQFCHI